MTVTNNYKSQFASDNCAGVCPEAWSVLEKANQGFLISYGEDPWTGKAERLIQEFFECDCEVYFVFSGTAGNSLALAALCQSYHAVFCHEEAHMMVDESAAPDYFTQGLRLIPINGKNGKIDPGLLIRQLKKGRGVHSSKPGAISITQASELGTVYTVDEMKSLGDLARNFDLKLHVDGARFANAVVSTKSTPAELTWKTGVDAITFGGAKNGLPLTEALVFFNKEAANEFGWRRKQAGQLASKMRYLSAPWVGLLEGGAWLRHAEHANRCASILAEGFNEISGCRLVFPCEANGVFVSLPKNLADRLLAKGWFFYEFIDGVYRFMGSWATSPDAAREFLAEVKNCQE